jgi:hypothetical protein
MMSDFDENESLKMPISLLDKDLINLNLDNSCLVEVSFFTFEKGNWLKVEPNEYPRSLRLR